VQVQQGVKLDGSLGSTELGPGEQGPAQLDVAPAFPPGQLGKGQAEEPIPDGERAEAVVKSIAGGATCEQVVRDRSISWAKTVRPSFMVSASEREMSCRRS